MSAGQDEARARAVLAEMQDRLASGPHSALGVSPQATPAEIRAAFLQLTKTYHPARFGRLSTETQKLSNEVFLGLRAAHDAIGKPAGSHPRPSAAIKSAVRQTGSMSPLVRPPAPTTAAIPSHASGSMPVARPPTAPMAIQPRVTQPTPVQRSIPLKPMPTAVKPSGSGPIQSTPPQGSRVVTPAKKPIDGEANVMELLHRGQWDAANAAIDQLLAKQPDSARYRSLRAYVKGRKAQLGGERDEARVELENALQLDPELQLAKTALGELFTRRK